MDLAFLLFQKVLVMLIFLGIGAICFKSKLITAEGNKSITNFVLYAATPCLIFASFQQEYSKKLLIGLFVTVGLSVIGFILYIIFARIILRKKDDANSMVERFSVIYTNCGFMGIPLANELFGAEGVFYITAFNALFSILVWSHGVYLITGETTNISFKRVLLNPSIISTVIGIVFFCASISLPELPRSAVNSISAVVSPLAMVVAGVTIAQTNILKALKNPRIYFIAFAKLLLLPIVLAVVLTLIFKQTSINNTVLLTTILAFACPTATIGTMFAIRYNKNATYAAEIFALTTIASVITMPIVIYIQSLI